MNISPISFGSAYKVDISNNDGWVTLNRIDEFGTSLIDDTSMEVISQDSSGNIYKTVILNDKFDNDFEVFLRNYGIKFSKTTTKDMLSEEGIKKRMRFPKYAGRTYLKDLVSIKTDEFDKVFAKNPYGQYLGSYETMSQPDRYDRFKEYLRTNEPIDVSEVFVSEVDGKPQVDFQDGRHRYAVLRDMGFKTIPVVMTESSLLVAKKFGLV